MTARAMMDDYTVDTQEMTEDQGWGQSCIALILHPRTDFADFLTDLRLVQELLDGELVPGTPWQVRDTMLLPDDITRPYFLRWNAKWRAFFSVCPNPDLWLASHLSSALPGEDISEDFHHLNQVVSRLISGDALEVIGVKSVSAHELPPAVLKTALEAPGTKLI